MSDESSRKGVERLFEFLHPWHGDMEFLAKRIDAEFVDYREKIRQVFLVVDQQVEQLKKRIEELEKEKDEQNGKCIKTSH